MARNKVLEKAKVTMPSGRNPFDLSQIRSATALAGELNLCYAQPVVAGTKGHISRKCFTRTADIVSPAFHSVTEHFDFFIVPIHSLWRQWENWKLNINDMQDTNLVPWNTSQNTPDLNLPNYAPRLDYTDLSRRLGYVPISGINSADTARLANDVIKLTQAGGFGESVIKDSTFPSKVMSTFIPAAYQKCYFERYRNTAYESNNPYAYNFDWLYDGTHNGLLNPDAQYDPTTPDSKDTYVARELFRMRRVNYRNDYYHNLYPALNYVRSTPSGIWSLPSSVAGASVNSFNSFNQPVLSGVSNTDQLSPSVISGQVSSQSRSVSVQQIRAIFALDKLMRASAYAPKHVRDQYKAQFGVDGVEDFDMQTERIGSFQSDVNFQEVTNMAQSVTANLGDLGAKGLGGSSDKDNTLSYYAKYDSIIIGLHYFMPRARYDAKGLHPWNIKIAREDFYIRAFERLGLRPFYSYYIQSTSSTYQIAWTIPNFEYKILPDLNEGPFMQTYSQFEYDETNDIVVRKTGLTSELSTFVPHTSQPHIEAFDRQGNITADYFKVSPNDLDNIFKVAVPADHRLSYYQFFGEFRIINAVVAPMDVHGQPSL